MKENLFTQKQESDEYLKLEAIYGKRKLRSGMVEGRNVSSNIFDGSVLFLGVLAAFICFIPMWHVLMSSFSDGAALLEHSGLVLWPVGKPTLEGYDILFSDQGLYVGYFNTIIYVVAIVGIGFVSNVVCGFCLSRKTKLSGMFMIFFLFPIMFGGGMVSTYMVMSALGLVDSRWAIILLESVSVANIIIGLNAFRTVPESTVEAARLDGVGVFGLMFKVMLPQCIGMFIVTVLMSFVGAWNSWMTAKIYVPLDNTKWPLQLWINELTTQYSGYLQTAFPVYARGLVQYCVIIAAVAPILIVFPFFQDRMEKGVVIGAVKG
jgi:putative aldouronate transport system permease protein